MTTKLAPQMKVQPHIDAARPEDDFPFDDIAEEMFPWVLWWRWLDDDLIEAEDAGMDEWLEHWLYREPR